MLKNYLFGKFCIFCDCRLWTGYT